MRDAMRSLGGDPALINPLAPVELVLDHSVIVDVFGTPEAFERNVEIEYQRNMERYQFLRSIWTPMERSDLRTTLSDVTTGPERARRSRQANLRIGLTAVPLAESSKAWLI